MFNFSSYSFSDISNYINAELSVFKAPEIVTTNYVVIHIPGMEKILHSIVIIIKLNGE